MVEPTLLGSVEDIDGQTVSVRIHEDTHLGLNFVDGKGYRIGQVGSFVRIPIGYDDLFGVISKIGASAAPDSGESLGENEEIPTEGRRWMTIQLIGESTNAGPLERGISRFPTIGDGVHLVTEEELTKIYSRPESEEYLSIGTVVGSETIPSLVDLNKLVTRHSALLGSTGAGKSTTVASILHQITSSSELSSPRVLVLDIHGEYSRPLRNIANVFRIDPDENKGEQPLYIPYWALTFEQLLSVTFGNVRDSTDRGGIMERVLDKKKIAHSNQNIEGIDEDNITADTPVPFSIHKLWLDLYKEVVATHESSSNQSLDTVAYREDEDGEPVEPGDPMEVIPPETRPHGRGRDANRSQSTLNIRRQIHSLAYKLRDSRHEFLFEPGAWKPNEDGVVRRDLDELLGSWLGGESGVTILDLSGIPSSVRDVLIGALLRIVYDSLFWARNIPEGGREKPLLLVLEEAHSYVGAEESGPASQAVQQIAKEGRKYGIGLLLVSQRPTEVDNTILSQCGTFFAMRLTNSKDRNVIESSVSDNLRGIFNMLPILRTGEMIVVGEAVRFPTRTKVSPPPDIHSPDSGDPVVYSEVQPGGWNQELSDPDYSEVLQLWRKQDPTSIRRRDLDEVDNDE